MANRLARETSPYLQQHAGNPVDWYPWSEEALQRARAEDKPILLSIGYSACHWCHVMAHESFEDEATAALMNELYVNIKVDREERPDLDRIYQTAHQLYNGRAGGWPLTCFLTPNDHVPIVVGTYFPKEPRYGMPAFAQVLREIDAYYRTYPADVAARGTALRDAFARMEAPSDAPAAALSAEPIERARQRLAATFDSQNGGFGGAPKFPHTTALELLLELGGTGGEPPMLALSLDRMALAGLYDQLAGGFFRYSVDRRWSIPHFEKMLYDNAQLLGVYSDAHAATGDALYARVASETADFIVRDMQDASGGYYATIDADSEGEEGKYYLWAPQELDALLSPAEAALAKRVFGLDGPPNFEERLWHLHRRQEPEARADAAVAPDAEVAADAAVAPDAAEVAADTESAHEAANAAKLFAAARARLLAARAKRVPPGRDEKILVSWNGLMIRGMAKAARRLKRPELAESATRAVDFIRAELWRDGRLMATYKDGRARLAAYLDDHAFLAAGLLELLEIRWRNEDLDFAVELTEVALAHFADPAGGFFFTADDHETLIHRPKPLSDEAVPSGNAVMLRVLLELGSLLGEPRYLDAAERGLAAASAGLAQYPDAHASLLIALDRYLEPPELVVVRGSAEELGPWRNLLDRGYAARRSAFCIPNDAPRLPGLLAARAAHGSPVAYVCLGTECRAPITDIEALRAALEA